MRRAVTAALVMASATALAQDGVAPAKQAGADERPRVAIAPRAASASRERTPAGAAAEPPASSGDAAAADDAQARREAARRDADERRFLEETWTRP
jgi:hypothetical protein